MAKTDRARKLLVRAALVTRTTIATLVGAQNFAMLNAHSFWTGVANPADEQNNIVDTLTVIRTPVPVTRSMPEIAGWEHISLTGDYIWNPRLLTSLTNLRLNYENCFKSSPNTSGGLSDWEVKKRT